MRTILVATAVSVFFAGCGPQQKEAVVRPVFELRGIRPGSTIEQAGKTVTQCTSPSEFRVCWFADEMVAGMILRRGSLEFGPKGFQATHLYWAPDYYELVLGNLRSAYGEPCRIDSAPARDALNTEVVSEAVVWCFATGEAKLMQYDHSYSESSFVYVDTNAVPEPVKPAVTPGTL